MKAPISLVLPTPVARAKQKEGKSRSKFVTVGNSRCIAASDAVRSPPLLGGTISVMRSRISSDIRCGGLKLRRPAMALTWRFIVIEPAYATAYSKDFGFSICFDAFKISMPTIFPVLS